MTKKITQEQSKASSLHKICYSIRGMVAATDFSRSYIFEAIKKNEIKTFRRGNRRFILHEDLVDFINQQASRK